MADLYQPGYAGELEPDEVRDIKRKLRSSWPVRIRWGFGKRARKFPAYLIRRVALLGDPDDRDHNRKLVKGK